MALAAELQLQAHVVEKDYALGWSLAGTAAHAVIGPRWVFKDGTCLKKCFFEAYRFFEDLDFTLQDAAHLDEAFLAQVCEENPAASNGSFDSKRAECKHSVLRLNRYFDGLDGWDEAAIADRGRKLAEMMCRAWPRPEQAA